MLPSWASNPAPCSLFCIPSDLYVCRAIRLWKLALDWTLEGSTDLLAVTMNFESLDNRSLLLQFSRALELFWPASCGWITSFRKRAKSPFSEGLMDVNDNSPVTWERLEPNSWMIKMLSAVLPSHCGVFLQAWGISTYFSLPFCNGLFQLAHMECENL